MKLEISNHFTGAVKFVAEIDCEEDAPTSVKIGLAVKWAVKTGANLDGASLYRASLDGANLNGASLDGANLNGASGINDFVKSIQIDTYPISYTAENIQIGCRRHKLVEWAAFSDAQIRAMDGKKALEWWSKYKEWIFQTIELCPAKPTGYEGVKQ